MANIRDIAKRARVSTATVSYVINQSRFVSKELSQRVLQAVDQLDFTPSRAARTLRHGKTFTIGLLTGDVTHRFAGELINGLEEAALKQGYGVVISNLRDNPDREEQCIKTLLNLQVDGMVYAGFGAARWR